MQDIYDYPYMSNLAYSTYTSIVLMRYEIWGSQSSLAEDSSLHKCYTVVTCKYQGADESLARPTSRRILFDGEHISFDASLVI